MAEYMSINKFREKIGWNSANYPYSSEALSLLGRDSVAHIEGAKIFNVHFGIYYKYDILADMVYFPIVFTKGGGRFVAHNEAELDEWIASHCLLCYLTENHEEKKEILRGVDYTEIRNEEIKYPNRLVFDELYDFDKEEFYGYRYIEI